MSIRIATTHVSSNWRLEIWKSLDISLESVRRVLCAFLSIFCIAGPIFARLTLTLDKWMVAGWDICAADMIAQRLLVRNIYLQAEYGKCPFFFRFVGAFFARNTSLLLLRVRVQSKKEVATIFCSLKYLKKTLLGVTSTVCQCLLVMPRYVDYMKGFIPSICLLYKQH